MNYGQFLNMVPEATLVAILIIVFFADFALSNSEKKHSILRTMTLILMGLQIIPCVVTESST
ncbi:MAG: NADH-quinone oxidoreductase subunit N, partial [Prevotella sp.]|nr:NADH-quinone oxidoreductase subunit N [Prevotella sp.]